MSLLANVFLVFLFVGGALALAGLIAARTTRRPARIIGKLARSRR